MKNTVKILYTGSRFKSFLKRNKISYKDAADALGIDKNTVGKAVRGGNLSIETILRICNLYQLKITDFFITTTVESASDGANYYISSIEGGVPVHVASEENFNYKKCENFNDQVQVVSDMIDYNKGMLMELSVRYDECRHALDELIAMYQSKQE